AHVPATSPKSEYCYKIVLKDKGDDVKGAVADLLADPDVDYAQPNYVSEIQLVPNDPLFTQQWAHQVTQAAAAWDIGRGSPSVIVAVVDVGVDYTHEDLAANIAPGGF